MHNNRLVAKTWVFRFCGNGMNTTVVFGQECTSQTEKTYKNTVQYKLQDLIKSTQCFVQNYFFHENRGPF